MAKKKPVFPPAKAKGKTPAKGDPAIGKRRQKQSRSEKIGSALIGKMMNGSY